MNLARRLLLNPLVIIIPIACLVAVLWHHYAASLPAANVASRSILPNGSLTTTDASGFPSDWQLFPHLDSISFSTPAGYASPTSLKIDSTNPNHKGNVTLTTPKSEVQNGHTYFYKGYYQSSIPFDLIMVQTTRQGASTRAIAARYLPSEQWTTSSHAFAIDNDVQSVQFVYSFTGTGSLRVSDTYLEADPTDVTLASVQLTDAKSNVIPAITSTDVDPILPSAWSSFSSGANKAKFTYVNQGNEAPYLRASVTDHTSGEAKWQYPPTSIAAGQAAYFTLTYRSDRPVDIVAEYVLKSGTRQFITLATLLPATDWTTYEKSFVAPPDADNVFVGAVLRNNGTLDTKDYLLTIKPVQGAASWKRPLVSLTFDDGWASTYQNGAALLDEYHDKATFYINPASIDTPNFMTSTQASALNTSGHELASHSHEHLDLTTLHQTALKFQLSHANDYFHQILHEDAVNFAAPFGSTDAQVMSYVRKYYSSARSTTDGINTKQVFDPYNLSVLYVGNDLSLDRLKAVLSQTNAAHGWLILVYHRIDPNAKGETTTSPDQLRAQLEAVRASGIPVTTIKNALQEIKQQ